MLVTDADLASGIAARQRVRPGVSRPAATLRKETIANTGPTRTVSPMTTTATTPVASSASYLLVRELVLARRRAGLSVEDLGAWLGVTRQAVSTWENSGGALQVATVSRWAAALGLRVGLVAGPEPEILRNPDGSPARPGLRTHVLVTGAGRQAVIDALLAELPGYPQLGADDLGAARMALQAGATPRPSVLVVNWAATDDQSRQSLRECLARARPKGWVVVLHADSPDEVPRQVQDNIGLDLEVVGAQAHARATTAAGTRLATWTVR